MLAILGKKVGMTQHIASDGQWIAATAIEVKPCVVTAIKSKEKHGYQAIQVGVGEVKAKNVKASCPPYPPGTGALTEEWYFTVTSSPGAYVLRNNKTPANLVSENTWTSVQEVRITDAGSQVMLTVSGTWAVRVQYRATCHPSGKTCWKCLGYTGSGSYVYDNDGSPGSTFVIGAQNLQAGSPNCDSPAPA